MIPRLSGEADVAYYSRVFRDLNRGSSPSAPKGVLAPHKPVLLLAVLDGIAEGEIAGNRIDLSPLLVARFRDWWSRLVTGPGYSPDIVKPFYHLRGDGFWHLVAIPGREFVLTKSHSPKSFSSLRSWVDCARVDAPLYALLTDGSSRAALQQVLIEVVLGTGAQPAATGYIDAVARQILNDTGNEYRTRAQAFDDEERAARSGVFRKTVLREYDYTCCVSGMRVVSALGVQLVDACHIVPWSETGDDTIGNGLSLCPNLHRAFDRGLFRVDGAYRVRVAPVFTEAAGAYALRVFEGKELLLPKTQSHWPGRENLEQHGERWRENFEGC